ncbi:MAG: folylpolyglutamate synthase/dihydrofolate synthase family protein [Actinomycetaceae bacterium]|nr:folylpolyglutamate synthase/dihydrofolate synthase family protein [Actinomycetaceae bacterium]
MSQDHPAFYGDTPEQSPASSIPADLLPYLEAANAPADEEEETQGTQSAHDYAQVDSNEDEARARLKEVLEASLLLGPDPAMISEIEGDYDLGEEWAEDIEEYEREQALTTAADDAALASRVGEIYSSIIARAPEHKIQPSLERVEKVMDILGDPQHTYPSIHIAGTNGKTTTARMVDSLLTALGMRVGRFTSPHLSDPRERISVEGEPISRSGFIAAWEDVAPYISMVDHEGIRLSFFEVFTVMALAAFADHPVDAAVVEVGMGGTWDSTNVINADVAVITPISRDHEKWLGSDLHQIAKEKAGIIKPGQIVVISAQDNEEVTQILLDRAREVDAIVRLEGSDWEILDRQLGVGGQLITVRTPSAVYEDIFVPLLGQHQAHNAGAAIVAVESFLGGRPLDAAVAEKGMLDVTSPGRLQVIRSSPRIIVDAAHNPGGARALATALEESFDLQRIVGVFSAMADKDVESLLAEIEPTLDHIVLLEMSDPRAMALEDLETVATEVFGADRVSTAEGLAEAVDVAAHIAEDSAAPADVAGIVVFGSVVLAGAIIDMVQARRR